MAVPPGWINKIRIIIIFLFLLCKLLFCPAAGVLATVQEISHG